MLIGITGGIGSGKSYVCQILRSWGYPVYDCDSRARHLMDTSPDIIAAVRRDILGETLPESVRACPSVSENVRECPSPALDRRAIADIVFHSPRKLARLNAIVHGAVRHDLSQWLASLPQGQTAFVESAILFTSGLERMVQQIWVVTAPEEVRIARACARDGLTPSQIRARIDAQRSEIPADASYTTIINDGITPLIPQLQFLIRNA